MQKEKHSILVIEDDEFMASLLGFMLARQNLQVTRVADGQAALAQLDGDQVPDGVVLDLMLPRVSGMQVLEGMKARQGWTDTPVLVLSALDTGGEIARAFHAGASDYVTKPFNPEEFMARLMRLLPRLPRQGA